MDSKTIRICKTCNTGYILPYDGHEVCEGCLGHEHAILVLSPLCLCRHCVALLVDDRQRRANTAAVIAEWADDFTVLLDNALSLLVSSESDNSDRDEEGASPLASPLRTERLGAAALPVSAATSLPVVGALVADPHRLAEEAVDVAKTSGVILYLCSTGAVAAPRTAAWQHLIQRTLWLQQTPGIPEPMRRQLLECPDGLFGRRLSMVDEMQAASEEAEIFQRHVSRPPPPPWQQRSAPGSRRRHRPPTATVSAPPAAPPPGPQAYQPHPPPSQAAASGQQRPRPAGSWGNEGDSLGAMEKVCRQLTYHLSPHSQWRRQGLLKRKPQAW
ncbi:unnamed protein product [Boreogadus saida]